MDRRRIAFLGPEASFTHMAALKSFGSRAAYSPERDISEVFASVQEGRAERGVVPVENSTEGMVGRTLDLIVDSPLQVCAELAMPVRHCLLGRASDFHGGAGVRVLASHPQALAQCRSWAAARARRARELETASTAAAARLAARRRGTFAIASRLAARLYGLEVLASGIEDAPGNVTRFWTLAYSSSRPGGRDKTSIAFSIPNRPGALFSALTPFKRARLNMTKIESRPTRRKAWEYVFFVDFEGHREESRPRAALNALARRCPFVRVLGSYPVRGVGRHNKS